MPRHHRANGNAQLFGGQPLGYGEGAMVPLKVTLLFVRRNRVVNNRLYLLLGEIGLQSVTLRTKDGKEVIHMLAGGCLRGEGYQGVVYACIIEAGDLTTELYIVIQMVQLNCKHGSLNLIETAVTPSIFKDILAL